jgi:hypothetical protein
MSPLLLAAAVAFAQDTGGGAGAGAATASTRWLAATGNLTAMGELYNRDGVGTPARPDQTGRIVANVTLALANGLVSMPLTALISTDQVTFRQSINQLGVSPTYRDFTFHAGHFVPSWSRYTLADQTLLGGGVEVTPGRLRAGVVAGRTRKAIEPDTLNVITGPGAGFARMAYAARLGFGDPEGTSIDAVALHVTDDRGSLDSALALALPNGAETNTVLGVNARVVAAGGRLHLEGRAAHSVLQREKGADAAGDAAGVELRYKLGDWTVGGTVEYLGTPFRTLGNESLVGDRLDYGVTLAARLAGGRVSFNGLGGWRQDNLEDELEATTRQALYSLTATLQPVPAFGIDFQATNNVNEHRPATDTSAIKNVTGLLSATPRFLWRTGSGQHMLVLQAVQQRSENSLPGAAALIDVTTRTYLGTWSLSFPSSLTFSATVTRTEFELNTIQGTHVTTIAPGISCALLAQRLQLSLQVQFTEYEVPVSPGSSKETFPLGQIRYRLGRGQSVQLKSSLRHHEFAGTGGSFDERIFTLQYSMTWR